MSVINKGTSFSNGEQLTADKINNLLDLATFDQSATDSASTTVNTSGQIVVADSGVSTAKIAADAVTTAKIAADAVTTAKILDANVTFAKLTDVIDDDTMVTATDTTLATSESIKAYVDEYAMKYSGATGTGLQVSGTSTYRDLDLSSVVGANRALVIMELEGTSGGGADIFFRTKGSTVRPLGSGSIPGWGASGGYVKGPNDGFTCVVTTNENGVLEYTGGVATGISYVVQAYQKLR
jgi:hypothetical protein